MIEFYASTSSYVNQEGKTIKNIDLCVSNIDKLGGGRVNSLKSSDGSNSSQSSSGDEEGVSEGEETNDISLDDIF